MPPLLQKSRFRQPIALLFVTFSILLFPGLVQCLAQAFQGPTGGSGLTEKVRMVKLYTVHQGKALNRVLGVEELQSGRVEVSGYVTGVLVLANSEMKAQVDGQNMSKIRSNGDGTYSIKYFGKVGSHEIGVTPFNSYYQKKGEDHRAQGHLEGYSLFPRVVGDAVSPNPSFQIALRGGDASATFSVQQRGYDTFQPPRGSVEFQYLGERLDKHMQTADFQARLNAITEGIRAVEQLFRAENLVERVKILDYEKVHNAVTCEEKNDIWFYINTFLGEPVEELRTIAQHEALHILVDRKRFAKDSLIRELFADLKGYEILSRERFMLITRGAAPGDSAQGNSDFFSFIDEKNFIPGMKGGHSSQNVDEFCTSFLHTLMYVENLRENLDRPLKSDDGRARVMNPRKKEEILSAYLRTLRTFLSVSEANEDAEGVRERLKASLLQAESVPL